jgi:hypothetical protein
MMRDGRHWLCGALLAIGVLCAGPGEARACVGDCDGDGAVSVADLVTGVRISLGAAPLSNCPAFDATPDGEVRIAELVMAVGNTLAGCPLTPSPEASETPTPADSPTATSTPVDTDTPGPSETPTTTPTLPPVAGVWREEPLAVTGSTCLTLVTTAFADDLASRPACEQTVELVGESAVTIEDCGTGTRLDGSLDRDGTIRVTYPVASGTIEDCTVELATSAVIPAGANPTTAVYTFAIAFPGESCPLEDCTIEAAASWTKEP